MAEFLRREICAVYVNNTRAVLRVFDHNVCKISMNIDARIINVRFAKDVTSKTASGLAACGRKLDGIKDVLENLLYLQR